MDVGPGDLYGAQYSGKSQVANLILGRAVGGGGLTGNATISANRHWFGNINPNASGSVQWSRNNASPVETLTARVTGKRTSVSGGHGDSSASTWYHATFELPDGRRDELAISAKDYAQLAEGDRGQLTRQGTRFKGFRRDGVSGSAR